MNNKVNSFIKNFSYTLVSNLISMAISALITFIIPKLIGVVDYGYWQLYLFYSSYVGILHFGWNDGIYLRYGGKEYKDLDKRLFFSQFYMLSLFQFILFILVNIIAFMFIVDINKSFIFKMIAVYMLIMNVRYMLLYILQGTNRIKEYAKIIIMDRVIYVVLVVFFLISGVREYKLMIMSELIGKAASLSFAMYYCKDIVFQKVSNFYFSFHETIKNISTGIKLMFANLASTLIMGVVRFGIERSWDVATFGKVSLTLSISNMMMLFINAVSIIIFPMLRRTSKEKLPNIYASMRDLLMVLLLGALIFYYPLKVILTAWLPKYADSLVYMALVFPMCLYEGKMALLVNTYLKALRKEKLMLKINLISLSLSLVTTFITTFIFKNLNLAIGSIVLLLAFRCALAEIYLSKFLKINIYKDIVLELMMTLTFILTGWFMSFWIAISLYLAAYLTYLFIKRKDIIITVKNLKSLIKA